MSSDYSSTLASPPDSILKSILTLHYFELQGRLPSKRPHYVTYWVHKQTVDYNQQYYVPTSVQADIAFQNTKEVDSWLDCSKNGLTGDILVEILPLRAKTVNRLFVRTLFYYRLDQSSLSSAETSLTSFYIVFL